MPLLALLTLLLSAVDHWTTYLCLRAPVDGWDVVEANPLAQWLFEALGLVPGLVVDSLLTVGAVAFLLATPHIPPFVKGLFFGLVSTATALAVANNWHALQTLGISPLGGA